MAAKRLTEEQRADAIRRLKAGGDVKSAAEAVGASVTAVAKLKSREIGDSRAVTTAGKPVAARLSAEELEALDRLQAHLGAGSRSDVLRSLVRLSVGMLEFPPEQAAQIDEIHRELHKIGVNINQIALAANRGRIDLAKPHWHAVGELRSSLPRVRTYLHAVVEEQRRRGVRLFQRFAEQQAPAEV